MRGADKQDKAAASCHPQSFLTGGAQFAQSMPRTRYAHRRLNDTKRASTSRDAAGSWFSQCCASDLTVAT
jgi:hypothetical protein